MFAVAASSWPSPVEPIFFQLEVCRVPHGTGLGIGAVALNFQNPKKPNRCREVSVEDIKALADHVDAALLPSTASRKLPEWVAKLQDAVALNCCKGDASGERGAAQ